MRKDLAGTLLVFDGNKYDYCFKESIKCLMEFCDMVIVAAGGDDNTFNDVVSLKTENLIIKEITQDQWDSQQGRTKLSFFTNICIEEAERLGYKYQFNLQSDEVTIDSSHAEIRKAVEHGAESYFCKRDNLWGSPYCKLKVPHERQPCSTEIIRLAKTKYRSYDDAESIAAILPDTYFLDGIIIYHYGFIRKKEVMKSKIINMQMDVFKMNDYDEKLKGMEVFDSTKWFTEKDLAIIDYPHPKIMKTWISTRP